MNRLDLQPDTYLATLLKQIEDDLREIKNKQQHSGLSGLLGYFVSNPGDWDVESSVSDTLPDVGYRTFEVIFTASGKQPFSIENVQLDIRFGGTGEENKPTDLPDSFLWGYDDGTNLAFMYERQARFDLTYSDNPTAYRWTFSFAVFGTLDFYIKASVSGSSDGTIEVNQVDP